MEYGFDYINGVKVPQTVIENDYILKDEHHGTVHVVNGTLTIQGKLHGTLDIQSGSAVIIVGEQHGTVSIASNARAIIFGELHGTTSVETYGMVTVEESGKMAGTLNNNGTVIVKGVFGGAQSGCGEMILEGQGCIKQPIIKNGPGRKFCVSDFRQSQEWCLGSARS